MAKNPQAKPRAKKANGYKFPDKLPVGEVLRDTAKKNWILGPSIGKGGFGEIYCASRWTDGSYDKSYPYAVKIEPHENGPLFVEKNLYIKIAKPEEVGEWKAKKKIKILGIPTYNGSGSHVFKDVTYRFLVIERFGSDLWSMFLKNNKEFPPAAVYQCAVQIIDALEFIHSKGYVHGDIKGANLLVGMSKGTENHVFLVDFGLASKYTVKEFARDPKKAHDGTIEYTSRDAHLGVPTRRGDMEILGFNLLHWLASTLPWEKDIKNAEKVAEKKNDLMKNLSSIAKLYPKVPKVISDFLLYVSKLEHNEEPDYVYCKNLFIKELKKLSYPLEGKLNFSLSNEITKKGARTPVKSLAARRRTPSRGAKESPVMTNGKASPKRKRDVYDSDMFEDDVCPAKNHKQTQTTPSNLPAAKKKAVKKATRGTKKADQPPKPSWRDAPTIKASSISVAGTYVKKTAPSKR